MRSLLLLNVLATAILAGCSRSGQGPDPAPPPRASEASVRQTGDSPHRNGNTVQLHRPSGRNKGSQRLIPDAAGDRSTLPVPEKPVSGSKAPVAASRPAGPAVARSPSPAAGTREPIRFRVEPVKSDVLVAGVRASRTEDGQYEIAHIEDGGIRIQASHFGYESVDRTFSEEELRDSDFVLELSPESVDLLVKGDRELKKGNPARAVEIYKRALKEKPQEEERICELLAGACLQLARLYQSKLKCEDSVNSFREAIRYEPDRKSEIQKELIEALRTMGGKLEKEGQLEESRKAYTEALRTGATPVDPITERLYELTLAIGDSLRDSGQHDAAADEYIRSLSFLKPLKSPNVRNRLIRNTGARIRSLLDDGHRDVARQWLEGLSWQSASLPPELQKLLPSSRKPASRTNTPVKKPLLSPSDPMPPVSGKTAVRARGFVSSGSHETRGDSKSRDSGNKPESSSGELARKGRDALARGRKYLKQGRLKQAEEQFRKVLQLNTEDQKLPGKVNAGLGDIALLREEFNEAVRLYDHALMQSDALGAYRVYLNRGIAKSMLSDDESLRSALKDVSQSLQRKQSAVAWNVRGIVYFALQETGRSVEDFQKAIQLDHGLVEAHFNLSRALEERGQAGDLDGAIQAITRALDFEPENCWFLFRRGRLLHERGRKREAENDFREAAESADAECLEKLGDFHSRINKPATASDYFRKAARLDPSPSRNASAVEALLRYIEEPSSVPEARLREALQMINESVNAEPENKAFRLIRARLSVSLRQFELGIKDLEYLLKADPDNHDALRARIRLYETRGKDGDSERAMQDYRKLEELRDGTGNPARTP